MKKKIFIISPVTIATDEDTTKLIEYEKRLERLGHIVHLPLLDTDQHGDLYEICTENYHAMEEADEVHVFYKGLSKGIHFDLGMAFAMHKKILVVDFDENTSEEYQHFLNDMEEYNNYGIY